jgi:hypothetical protein
MSKYTDLRDAIRTAADAAGGVLKIALGTPGNVVFYPTPPDEGGYSRDTGGMWGDESPIDLLLQKIADAIGGGGGSDGKVYTDETDTTRAFLTYKLLAGTGISKAIKHDDPDGSRQVVLSTLYGTSSGTACEGNDTRIGAVTAHASSHVTGLDQLADAVGGGTTVHGLESVADKLKLDGIAANATNTPLSSSTPQAVGTAGPGAGTSASKDDHIHAHGNQAGGSLHSVATNIAAGFMPQLGSGSSKFLREDATWQTVASGGSAVDIGVLFDESTDNPSGAVKGIFTFNEGDYSTATTIKFKAAGWTTNVSATLTGTVTLKTAAGVTVATLTFNSVTPGQQISADIKSSLPGSSTTYQIFMKVTGGGGLSSQDLLVIKSVYMEIR